jgi:hypothetical protein
MKHYEDFKGVACGRKVKEVTDNTLEVTCKNCIKNLQVRGLKAKVVSQVEMRGFLRSIRLDGIRRAERKRRLKG